MRFARIIKKAPENFFVGEVVQVLDDDELLFGEPITKVMRIGENEVAIKKNIQENDNDTMFFYVDKIEKTLLEFQSPPSDGGGDCSI